MHKKGHLDFKMDMDLSEYIFIWLAANSCFREFGIIYFYLLFNTFLYLKCQKGLNGHNRFINGHDFFRKCFHLMGSNKLYYVDIIIFLIYYLIPLCLSNVKRPKNGHHGPKNGHFGFENHHGSFWKYFHLIGNKKLY